MVDPVPTWTAAEADGHVREVEKLEWEMEHMSLDVTNLSPRSRKEWEDLTPRHRMEHDMHLRNVSKMLLQLTLTPPYKEHVQQCGQHDERDRDEAGDDHSDVDAEHDHGP